MDVQAVSPRLGGARVRNWRLTIWSSGLCLSMLLIGTTTLWGQRPTEYDVKAAYLFNFGKFLRQPDLPEISLRKSFDICVLGRSNLGGTLKKLTANEQNNGLPERTIEISHAAEARNCAILFVSDSEVERIDEELGGLAGAPVLTVSDMPHFLEHGGMISLEMQSNHVRFSVGLDAVNRAGLALSSQLLKVASQVTGKPNREVQ